MLPKRVLATCRTAFEGGYTSVKLYFMMGLPTETKEDIEGVADLAAEVVDLFYSLPDKPKGKGVNVTVSSACFVPKPFTPFQLRAAGYRGNAAGKAASYGRIQPQQKNPD